MIAIIFEVFPKHGKMDEYLDMATKMRPMVEGIEGFISVERFISITNPDKLLSISFFENEAAVDSWRNLAAHRRVQSKGRSEIFDDYQIKVLHVMRNYGMTDRSQAPKDSTLLHDNDNDNDKK
ncbi:MAG: antibiotic biosynthesis monooxygenase [Paracoccaceae bacterium]|jgi:heme-degrading monooxygenase HmoA